LAGHIRKQGRYNLTVVMAEMAEDGQTIRLDLRSRGQCPRHVATTGEARPAKSEVNRAPPVTWKRHTPQLWR